MHQTTQKFNFCSLRLIWRSGSLCTKWKSQQSYTTSGKFYLWKSCGYSCVTACIKTFYNSYVYHKSFAKIPKYNPTDVRFTKVLTNYSTEYNNSTFLQFLCQQLGVDVKDMTAMFLHFRETVPLDDLVTTLERYSITRLDIGRLYRYLDRYTESPEVMIEDD